MTTEQMSKYQNRREEQRNDDETDRDEEDAVPKLLGDLGPDLTDETSLLKLP